MVKVFWRHSIDVLAALRSRVIKEIKITIERARRIGIGNIELWVISAILGAIVGIVAFYFAEGVQYFTRLFYRSETNNLLFYTFRLPWWWLIMVPTLGGLVTGLILWRFTPDGRGRSISHVIEAAALKNGRQDERAGLASALASFVTLSTGGSAGQEGPLVHLGGVIATRISKFINASGMTARDLLGCAAAAAIGASFNAPIAGIVFAHEIILRHYAQSSFTPITIASVMGTITGHVLTGGNFAEIRFFELSVASYSEIPAFMLLGLFSGFAAILIIRSVFVAEDIGDLIEERAKLKPWMRPMFAGTILGIIAIKFPHIIGIGYQTTVKALHGLTEPFYMIIILISVKVFAVAVTLGGRMGGGIFSPSLMVGALTGLGFGQLAVQIGGDVGAVQLYALAGMAAVSAAVLGAPLSTAIIVFEMTHDWQAAIAVMTAVSVATGISMRLVDKSFFLMQLERRELHIAAGPQAYLLATFKVRAFVKPFEGSSDDIEDLIDQGAFVYVHQSFEEAMPIFEQLEVKELLVLETDMTETPYDNEILGQIEYLDVLKAYSHALGDVAAEEHS